MSDLRRVSPSEAHALVADGYTHVDVRSVAEFELEHPAGAFNVPLLDAGPGGGGMVANPDFIAVMKAVFPVNSRLVIGCRGGNRSLKAIHQLVAEGYTELVDQRAGFDAARDAFGQIVEPGWKSAGLPVETGKGGERSWEALRARRGT